MRLLGTTLVLVLAAAGCSGSGASYSFVPLDGATGGGGGGDLATTGGPRDLASAPLPDLAQRPPDLAQRPPDLLMTCVPGTYAGPVMATANIANVPTTLTGTVSLTAGAPQNGLLPVTGSMTGSTPQQGGTASATVTGDLDCAGRRLVNGKLTNGKINIPQLGLPLSFTGTLASDYDAGQIAFVNGTLMATGFSLTATGTWSASYTGP